MLIGLPPAFSIGRPYQKNVDYQVLRTFGCLAFASTLHGHRSKFHPRAIPSVFVGYPPGMKGYKLYDIENKLLFVSRDVVFHESVFPFHTITPQADIVDPFPDIVLPISPNFSGISDDFVSSDSQVRDTSEVIASSSNTNVADIGINASLGTDVHSSTLTNVPNVDIVPSTATQPLVDTTVVQSLANITTEVIAQSSRISVADTTLRRSSRAIRQPSYLRDYHCALLEAAPLPGNHSKFPLHKVLSYKRQSGEYRNFVLNVSSVYEPLYYHQSVPYLHWREAMSAELQAMEANNTWSIVSLPAGHHSVG